MYRVTILHESMQLRRRGRPPNHPAGEELREPRPETPLQQLSEPPSMPHRSIILYWPSLPYGVERPCRTQRCHEGDPATCTTYSGGLSIGEYPTDNTTTEQAADEAGLETGLSSLCLSPFSAKSITCCMMPQLRSGTQYHPFPFQPHRRCLSTRNISSNNNITADSKTAVATTTEATGIVHPHGLSGVSVTRHCSLCRAIIPYMARAVGSRSNMCGSYSLRLCACCLYVCCLRFLPGILCIASFYNNSREIMHLVNTSYHQVVSNPQSSTNSVTNSDIFWGSGVDSMRTPNNLTPDLLNFFPNLEKPHLPWQNFSKILPDIQTPLHQQCL